MKDVMKRIKKFDFTKNKRSCYPMTSAKKQNLSLKNFIVMHEEGIKGSVGKSDLKSRKLHKLLGGHNP